MLFVVLLLGTLLVPRPASPSASTMAVQPDGKIVLAGSARQWTPYCVTPARLHRCFLHRLRRPAVVRLDADGHPDPSFGVGGGIVDFRAPRFEGPSFASVALSPGGGLRLGSANGSRFQITALDGAGDPDFGFGHESIAVGPPAAAAAVELATILPQPDGSLVVGGDLATYAPKSFITSSSVAVAMRFSASGDAGERLGEVPAGTGVAQLADLVPQGPGFVAVGGLTELPTGRRAGFLVRFSGSAFPFDPSFGGGAGLVQQGPSSDSEEVAFASAAIDDDGLIAAGQAGDRILLSRYHGDGTLDTGFGAGGRVDPVVPAAGYRSAEATSVATQPDGRIVVGGAVSVSRSMFCKPTAPTCWRPFLARFQPDGQLDRAFGEGGFAIGSLREGPRNGDSDLELQPDGGILFSDFPLRVARYNADGSLDTSFGEGGEASLNPCQGTVAQRRRSGCLSIADVSFGAHGLSEGRPVSQLSARVSNPLDPIAAVKLVLPPELAGRRGTAGDVHILAVPRSRVRIRVYPRFVVVSRLGNARGVHVAVAAGVLRRIAPVDRRRKLSFRVEIEFRDGTSETLRR